MEENNQTFMDMRKNLIYEYSDITYTNVKMSDINPLRPPETAGLSASKLKMLPKILTPRNPFKMDEKIINYDQDSEDELADL